MRFNCHSCERSVAGWFSLREHVERVHFPVSSPLLQLRCGTCHGLEALKEHCTVYHGGTLECGIKFEPTGTDCESPTELLMKSITRSVADYPNISQEEIDGLLMRLRELGSDGIISATASALEDLVTIDVTGDFVQNIIAAQENAEAINSAKSPICMTKQNAEQFDAAQSATIAPVSLTTSSTQTGLSPEDNRSPPIVVNSATILNTKRTKVKRAKFADNHKMAVAVILKRKPDRPKKAGKNTVKNTAAAVVKRGRLVGTKKRRLAVEVSQKPLIAAAHIMCRPKEVKLETDAEQGETDDYCIRPWKRRARGISVFDQGENANHQDQPAENLERQLVPVMKRRNHTRKFAVINGLIECKKCGEKVKVNGRYDHLYYHIIVFHRAEMSHPLTIVCRHCDWRLDPVKCKSIYHHGSILTHCAKKHGIDAVFNDSVCPEMIMNLKESMTEVKAIAPEYFETTQGRWARV